MAAPATILVRMPNWLGDCVMATPALRLLRETFPDARLLLAGRRPFAKLLAAQPGVAGVVTAPDSGAAGLAGGLLRGRRAMAAAGLTGGIDAGILFTNSLSTALWLWRVGAKRRVGYRLNGRGVFLTDPVPYGESERLGHFIGYYRRLVEAAAKPIAETTGLVPRDVRADERFRLPTLSVGEQARERAGAMLREAGIAGAYAALAPASAYGEVKDWPVRHYQALTAMLSRDFSLPVVVTGSTGQAEACEAVAAGQAAAANVAGKTDMETFAALLAGAALFVGGDSGGAHVAAAAGIPTVVIFGVTNPTRTRPSGPKVRMLGAGEEKDVKLSSPAVREAAKHALAAIAPEAVAAAAREAMG